MSQSPTKSLLTPRRQGVVSGGAGIAASTLLLFIAQHLPDSDTRKSVFIYAASPIGFIINVIIHRLVEVGDEAAQHWWYTWNNNQAAQLRRKMLKEGTGNRRENERALRKLESEYAAYMDQRARHERHRKRFFGSSQEHYQ